MSEIEDSLVRFESYGAIERLEAALDNPDDKILLYSLSRQNEKHEEADLSIIWAFAMTKGRAMEQEWHMGTPWQIHLVEDHPDRVFPDLVYRHLESHLGNQDDTSILRNFLDEDVRMECLEAPPWAMWESAVAKGEASSTDGAQIQRHRFRGNSTVTTVG